MVGSNMYQKSRIFHSSFWNHNQQIQDVHEEDKSYANWTQIKRKVKVFVAEHVILKSFKFSQWAVWEIEVKNKDGTSKNVWNHHH